MISRILFFQLYFSLFLVIGCHIKSERVLKVVSYGEFEQFVSNTGYVTDAEKFGWSIVQTDVFHFKKVNGATWKKPDGQNSADSKNLPVTQVSYNDAVAYTEWTGSQLPSYEEYWDLITFDKRRVVSNRKGPISNVDDVNILGNVWEITRTTKGTDVRLAGGSLFCSPASCHGTSKERELYVDKQTGNVHIGFAVIAKKE